MAERDKATGNPGWSTVSFWLLGAGLITAAAAAVAGVTDFLGDSRIRELSDAWQHAIGNVIAVVLSLFSWFWRYQHGDAVLPLGLILSIIVALIIAFTGWKGGDLVYRHRVAVHDERDPDAALTSLKARDNNAARDLR